MIIETEREPEMELVACGAATQPGGLARFTLIAADDSGDVDDFDEEDFDDEFDDDFEEELEDEYELSEFEEVNDEDLAEDDEDLAVLGGDFVDEDAEPEEAPLAEVEPVAEEEEPGAKGKKKKKGPAPKEEDDEDLDEE